MSYTDSLAAPAYGSPGSSSWLAQLLANVKALRQRTYYYTIEVFGANTLVSTGDGKKSFVIPAGFAGMDLVEYFQYSPTAGSGAGSVQTQLHNVTDDVDMLSSECTTPSGNKIGSTVTIDTTHDDVALYDELRLDVNGITATPPYGLVITMGFRYPTS